MRRRMLFVTAVALLMLAGAGRAHAREVFGRVVAYEAIEGGFQRVSLKTVQGNGVIDFYFPPNSAEMLAQLTQKCPHPEKTLFVRFSGSWNNGRLQMVRCVTWDQVGSRPAADEPYWDWPADPVEPIPVGGGGSDGEQAGGGNDPTAPGPEPANWVGPPGSDSGRGRGAAVPGEEPAGGDSGTLVNEPADGDESPTTEEAGEEAGGDKDCPGGRDTFTGSGGIVNGNLRIGERFDVLEISPANATADLFSELREAVRSGKTVTVTLCHGESGDFQVEAFTSS